jgi:hypothetical protein
MFKEQRERINKFLDPDPPENQPADDEQADSEQADREGPQKLRKLDFTPPTPREDPRHPRETGPSPMIAVPWSPERAKKVDRQDRRLRGRISPSFSPTGD